MGRKDEVLRLPSHGSISMNLSGCLTTTTIAFSKTLTEDSLLIDGAQEGKASKRAFMHLDRIRAMAQTDMYARIESHNTFPRSTGLSSSSSGFAALTLAATEALGMKLSKNELSILARQGSGSACRSIPDGFCEWLDGDSSEASYAVSIFPPDHWKLCDVVAVVTTKPKEVASSDTHRAVLASPLYAARVASMPALIKECKAHLAARDLGKLGPLIEQESDDLHALYESVGIFQRSPEALRITRLARTWRREFPVYYTLNTGQNVHLICEEQHVPDLKQKLAEIDDVRNVIVNEPARGARISEVHLF
jgi:diphosphomevalonate decarboxylase